MFPFHSITPFSVPLALLTSLLCHPPPPLQFYTTSTFSPLSPLPNLTLLFHFFFFKHSLSFPSLLFSVIFSHLTSALCPVTTWTDFRGYRSSRDLFILQYHLSFILLFIAVLYPSFCSVSHFVCLDICRTDIFASYNSSHTHILRLSC